MNRRRNERAGPAGASQSPPAVADGRSRRLARTGWRRRPGSGTVLDVAGQYLAEIQLREDKEAVIALGSNVRDRIHNFNKALQLMKKSGIGITRHGCLYETEPAYVTDRPLFLNSSEPRPWESRIDPDSFNDWGNYQSMESAIAQVHLMISRWRRHNRSRAQSTRPLASRVSVEEELDRSIPILEACRCIATTEGKLLSVDTFYSKVALEAVNNGAHIVNDASSGKMDADMFRVVAGLEVPYIATHMRGDPTTMQNNDNLQYDNVVEQVALELNSRVRDAELSGIPAWRVIVDPGIGFSKNTEHNLDILLGLGSIREELAKKSLALSHAPLLIRPSRKKFLGMICNLPAAVDRDASSDCFRIVGILGGANIVRVHNIGIMWMPSSSVMPCLRGKDL
ncbi:hypothetical protein Dimus_030063 [Dionaea muscipula]